MKNMPALARIKGKMIGESYYIDGAKLPHEIASNNYLRIAINPSASFPEKLSSWTHLRDELAKLGATFIVPAPEQLRCAPRLIFAKLRAEGTSQEDIASQFGYDLAVVRQVCK